MKGLQIQLYPVRSDETGIFPLSGPGPQPDGLPQVSTVFLEEPSAWQRNRLLNWLQPRGCGAGLQSR